MIRSDTGSHPEATAEDGIDLYALTHNETSTGVTNDLASISRAVREFDKLRLVDGVSSIGSIDLPVDEWQIDVAVTGSQKGWMCPPGLAMISMNQRAWQAYDKARMPRYYLDVGKARKFLEEKGETPWTPGVSTYYALSVALDMVERETLPKIFARHARTAKAAREGMKSLGLSLFPEESHASYTVTAINGPSGVDLKKLLQTLREEHSVVLSGGQGKLDGKIFRIGHLGLDPDGARRPAHQEDLTCSPAPVRAAWCCRARRGGSGSGRSRSGASPRGGFMGR